MRTLSPVTGKQRHLPQVIWQASDSTLNFYARDRTCWIDLLRLTLEGRLWLRFTTWSNDAEKQPQMVKDCMGHTMGSHIHGRTADYMSRKFITGHKARQRLQLWLSTKRPSHMPERDKYDTVRQWVEDVYRAPTVSRAVGSAGNKATFRAHPKAERRWAGKAVQMRMVAAQDCEVTGGMTPGQGV